MKVFAIQTARAGSKSVLYKNEISVDGKALFLHNLHHALDCPQINHVFCSTDIDTSRYTHELTGVTLIARPYTLATDHCSHHETICHALIEAERSKQTKADLVIVLLGNSLSAFSEHLSEGIAYLKDDETLDSVMSVARFNMFNPLRAFKDSSGRLEPMISSLRSKSHAVAKNDKEAMGDVFFFNGGFWIIRREVLLANAGKGAFPWLGNAIGYVLQDARYQELDAEWQRALF